MRYCADASAKRIAMKNSFLIIIVFCLFWSCQASQQASTSKSQNDTSTPSSVSLSNEIGTFKGEFKSTQGVKTELSCYCGNGGYLTTETGETISICFDAITLSSDCNAIEVKGTYIMKSNDPEPSNPCSKGTMKIFKVQSYQCI